MGAGRMHADELHTDASLVGRMLAAQFPKWADLPIESVASAGTENAIYRLGDDMAVRLPRRPGATEQVKKLHRWLPSLAPLLPLAVPVPLAGGMPAEDYPSHWSVCRWLEGEEATSERIADPAEAAVDLAGFVTALRKIDAAGGRRPGATTSAAECHSRRETPPPGPPSPAWTASSIQRRRPRRGMWPCRRRRGTARPSGSMETSRRGTCWPLRGASAP